MRNGPQPGGAYYLKSCDEFGRRAYYQIKDPEGVWRLPPPYVATPPPRSTAADVERVRAALPADERQVDAEVTRVTGLDSPFPPPPPREVTDEEMIEHGLMERPPPPPKPAAPPGQPAAPPDLSNLDPASLALLGQLLQGQLAQQAS